MVGIVEVTELSREFGDKLALNQVSFTAGEGLVYGLVGVNGAGKTTFIKHLLGLLRALSGKVEVFGHDPVRSPVEVLGNIGYLSEERDLPDWMTIDQLMRYTSAYYPNWDNDYAYQLLDTFQLDSTKRIKNLSKGMRAQTGLVAAVAHRPRLLILDEPSSGLDAVVREDILNAILRTVSGEGRTVIFSSHLLDEVERMSDHITMIHDGEIVVDDPIGVVRKRYHRSAVHFDAPQDAAPQIQGILGIQGNGDTWHAVHDSSPQELASQLRARGGSIVETHIATLQEIFIARVGRTMSDFGEAP